LHYRIELQVRARTGIEQVENQNPAAKKNRIMSLTAKVFPFSAETSFPAGRQDLPFSARQRMTSKGPFQPSRPSLKIMNQRSKTSA
jgi:hypothetical protein